MGGSAIREVAGVVDDSCDRAACGILAGVVASRAVSVIPFPGPAMTFVPKGSRGVIPIQ